MNNYGNQRSPFSATFATSNLLDQNRVSQQPNGIENSNSVLEKYKDPTQFQRPNLTPVRVIGNGAFGFVFEAYCENRKCKVALKRTQKAGNIISREFEILDMLRGKENVVQLLDFFYSLDEK